MARRHWLIWIAVAAVLGCGPAGSSPAEIGPGGDGLERLRQQARDALARYDKAVADAGGSPRFVPVGELTGQLGDWGTRVRGQQAALAAGRVVAATALPAAPPPTGTGVWDDGTTRSFPLISAGEALKQSTAANEDCPAIGAADHDGRSG
jgi:hypothetical protein